MKIGILSDSHDNMAALIKAVGFFNDAGVDLVIHAGDLISPFTAVALKKLHSDFIAIYGNNDGEKAGLYQALNGNIHRSPHLHTFHNKKIMIMHEPDHLDILADSGAYDTIIYGHTHVADIRYGKTLIINPGECGGWVTGKRSIALWNLDEHKVDTIPI
ncbi:metallophosphoesterase [bacterium]|nr:metallophosphoesterase [bacterium]